MKTRLAASMLFAVFALAAQTFEVASVKRSAPDADSGARSTGAVPRRQEPGRINYPGVRLKGVIAVAYGVDEDLVDGPQWLTDERYDIVATLPGGAPQTDVPVMLQHLLAERFRMAVHEESRPRPGFALVAGRGQPKITASGKPDGGSFGFETRNDRIVFSNMTMAQFAKFLASSSGRPVVDHTEIPGRYDITLMASMDDVKAGSFSGAIGDLGLKLVPNAAPAKFIVVDKADKVPTEN